ncbi:MAG TPA: hypothetical protein VJQ61_09530, partial [Sinomonas sp.]|nr:hypothetical protein [Sinomonas sp.]
AALAADGFEAISDGLIGVPLLISLFLRIFVAKELCSAQIKTTPGAFRLSEGLRVTERCQWRLQ